jgi:hypothetical protein
MASQLEYIVLTAHWGIEPRRFCAMAVEPKAAMAAMIEKRILSSLVKRIMDEAEQISAERSLLNQGGCPTLKAYCRPADPIVTELRRRMAEGSIKSYWSHQHAQLAMSGAGRYTIRSKSGYPEIIPHV